MNEIRGLLPATFTPMNADGSIALDRIEGYAERLASQPLGGVFVCGTTGECLSLTDEERMAVAQRWCEVSRGGLPVIVHVGHTSLEAAVELARHAEKAGAQAIAALAPCFFKPNLPELVEFCQRIAAAAPRTPFYYYHIPSMTGVQVPVADFIAHAAEKIPTLAGAKFTYEDLMDLQNCLRVSAGRFNIMFGRDEILLAGLALGCTAAVGSTYNFAAPAYRRVIQAFQTNDLAAARAAQQQCVQMIGQACTFGGVPAMKVMMKLAGMDCGPVRLPLRNLTAGDETDLRTALERLQWQRLLA